MRNIREIMAWVLTILFIMGLGASAYHQYNVLIAQRRHRQQYEQQHVQMEGQQDYVGNPTVTDENVDNQPYCVYEAAEDDVSEEEYMDSLELLAACVEAEAGNQGLTGKRLVADVVLNRVDSPDFPDTIEAVITQPYHFSSYWNGMMDSVSITEESFRAVEMELEERSYPSLLYFTAGGYGQYGTPWKKVGDHYFSTK